MKTDFQISPDELAGIVPQIVPNPRDLGGSSQPASQTGKREVPETDVSKFIGQAIQNVCRELGLDPSGVVTALAKSDPTFAPTANRLTKADLVETRSRLDADRQARQNAVDLLKGSIEIIDVRIREIDSQLATV